jgi:hypothetical protein
MAAIGRAVLFGFLVWLAAFVAAFLIFPLRESSRPLFESIMPVVLSSATAALAVVYFRGVTRDYLKEGIVLGCLWLAISLAIDAPLMLLGGPMKMTLAEYLADIGVTYLLIPAVTIGIGLGCRGVAREGGPRLAERS